MSIAPVAAFHYFPGVGASSWDRHYQGVNSIAGNDVAIRAIVKHGSGAVIPAVEIPGETPVPSNEQTGCLGGVLINFLDRCLCQGGNRAEEK